jgi:hypothetical protein
MCLLKKIIISVIRVGKLCGARCNYIRSVAFVLAKTQLHLT